MVEDARVETACRLFANLTGELEDAATVAAQGQGVSDLDAAHQTCDELVTLLDGCVRRLRGFRRSPE
jgi:hypothetical protein